MRHRVLSKKFGRSASHRDALMSGLVCNLIAEKRIKTTLPKAKAARRLAEKMVTLAKRGTLDCRKKAIAVLHRETMVTALFAEVAPQCQDRRGGYTRITKMGKRRSDSSEMAVLEWVSIAYVSKKRKPKQTESEPQDVKKDESK